jgi:hypothetical protein
MQLEVRKVIYDKLQIQINTLHLHFYTYTGILKMNEAITFSETEMT